MWSLNCIAEWKMLAVVQARCRWRSSSISEKKRKILVEELNFMPTVEGELNSECRQQKVRLQRVLMRMLDR